MRADTILVIPFADGIGDFINAQPLLAALKRRFPRATFTVAASDHGNRLINDPTIEVVKPSSLGHKPGPVAVALRPLLPQKLLAWMAGPAFDRELGPFDLVINFFYAWERGMNFTRYWTPQFPPLPGAVHSLDYLADKIGQELGIQITPEQRKPHLVLRPRASGWAAGLWREWELVGERVVGLVPSSNMVIKRWPIQYWLTLDRHLGEQGYRTLLFCDREGGSVQRAFANAGSAAIPIYTTLDNVAATLALCDLAVGVDTGLLHMAGALGVQWVGLFGPTNPEVTGPYDRKGGLALVAPFRKVESCSPCWKNFKYQDDRCRTLPEGSCLQYLGEDAALNACLQLLEDRVCSSKSMVSA